MTDLTITQQALDNRQLLLTIVVPDHRTEKALREAARRLAKNYRFPGFRPGKAPYHIVAQRIGRAALLEQAIEDIGSAIYLEALEASDLRPYAPGNLTDIASDPLTLTFEVPLAPIVDPGDYRSLRLDIPSLDEAEVEEHLQADLSGMNRGRTNWAPVERPIQYGDLATISLKLSVEDEVVLEQEDWDFSPSESDYTLLPEFDAAFIGLSSGESKSFVAVFPAEGDSAWAGKEGQFEISVTGVRGKTEQVYDDAFAAEHGFENAADMFQQLRQHAASHVQADIDANFRQQVLEKLIENADLNYPPAAVDRTVEMIMAEQESYYQAYGFESTAEVLRLQNRSEDDYREGLRPLAEDRLRQELVFDAIAAREHFPVSDYELDELLVSSLEEKPDELDEMRQELLENAGYRAWLTKHIQRRKAMDLLVAIARGEEVPAPGQHQAEQAPPESESADTESESADAESETADAESESADAKSETADAESESADAESDPADAESEIAPAPNP